MHNGEICGEGSINGQKLKVDWVIEEEEEEEEEEDGGEEEEEEEDEEEEKSREILPRRI